MSAYVTYRGAFGEPIRVPAATISRPERFPIAEHADLHASEDGREFLAMLAFRSEYGEVQDYMARQSRSAASQNAVA